MHGTADLPLAGPPYCHCTTVILPTYVPPQGLPSLYLGDSPFELTSFALSLLMVFRTEASYDRCVASHCMGI